MAEETLVFIREAGQEDFDILYVTGTPDIDAFHELIREALGVNEEVVKVTMDGIAIRNANGIKFMLKKSEPKVEVTFAGTGEYTTSFSGKSDTEHCEMYWITKFSRREETPEKPTQLTGPEGLIAGGQGQKNWRSESGEPN
jgi:hypothetical protein